SRGYGRLSDDLLEVRDDTPAEDTGDEPALIRRTTGVPVFVARQRAAAARALLAAHPTVDVLLCDDGLQHLALARDIAVVVFDDRGVGNGWQLPAGLLREPWPPGHHASRPDLLLHQSRDQHPASALTVPTGLPAFGAVRRLAEHAFNAEQHRIPLTQLRDQPVVAVAGIARPDVFFDMLQERGLQLARTVPLADHAGADAYRAVLQNAQQAIVCTEKDAVKLFAAARDQGGTTPPIWAVPLALQVDPGFFTAIDALLHQVRESLAKRARATD
uniref:tetraacyldisaccharide 4'-kinase n=1 Tax=Hydrogenophaga sp. TaxID=1904254 RepID=UPI003561B758